jgi:arylformamidase
MNEMTATFATLTPPTPLRATPPASGGRNVAELLLSGASRIIDISLELDPAKFRMRTYAGFRKDMQFETEIIKDYGDGGLGQRVRGVHMRLHAGSHIDAPSHMIEGGKDMHELPLARFIGPAVVADVRHRGPKQAITADDLSRSAGSTLQRGDRLLLRSDNNEHYDGSPEWMARASYLGDDAIDWCAAQGVSLVGFDFYHAAEPVQDGNSCTTRKLLERDILTMPYLTNLKAIRAERFVLIALPLKMKDVEASPVRAIAVEA